MDILSVRNLSKNFGSKKAVDSISFDIEKGEIFALIGPNGAGKSTTLKIIATILTKNDGRVMVDGNDLDESPHNVRRSISYLPEESGAYKNLSGLDYLHLMASLYADSQEQRREMIATGKEVSGLGDRLADKTKTYSKGMTRKLLLARTVMSNPKLAILDEPTSGLDVLNAMEIRKDIKNMAKKGMSVLLSSHNMLEIEFLSHRVGIIINGKLFDVGTPQELKKKYSAQNLEDVFEKLVKDSKIKVREEGEAR